MSRNKDKKSRRKKGEKKKMIVEEEEGITAEVVHRLADLSRLSLTPAQERHLTREMADIVSYFATIDRAKVEGLEPSHHVVEVSNVFRDDKIVQYDSDSILRLVPSKRGRQVRAPRVF